MSRNTNTSAYIVERLENEERFAMSHPQIFKLLNSDQFSFRGLTCFIGDNNDCVVGLKAFAEEGQAVIMWSSGTDLIEAFKHLNQAVGVGKWRIDKNFRG